MPEDSISQDSSLSNSINKREDLLIELNSSLVSKIEGLIASGNDIEVLRFVKSLHFADVADLIEIINPEYRKTLIGSIVDELRPEVLTKLDDTVLGEVVRQLGVEKIAVALGDLETDEVVEVIDDLDAKFRNDVLQKMEISNRAGIEESLSYPEQSAGRLMQREHMAIPIFWNVGQVIDHLRETVELPDEFYELQVVDEKYHPVGIVPLNTLLRSKRPEAIKNIMISDIKLVPVDIDQEEVAYLFQQYDLVSASVINEDGRLIGVIMYDDIIDVIKEEAEDDILRLGRVGDAGINDSIFTITRDRFIWLMVNLMTAALASLVIFLFDATIEELVALAVLMPIVASMGGNAGTQTLTVTVRALASRDITSANAARYINKELIVSLLNGCLFSIIIGLIAWLWFENYSLALVICAAMMINMLAAGLSGILIPLGLSRVGADPALAATVFVTTVTDVIGFFAFLGLATIFIL